MRKWFHERFHISEDGKVREKALLSRAALTITTVVLCLVVLTFTAYAYFSCSVTSGSLTVRTASFDTQVTIQSADGTVSITTEDNMIHTARLEAGKDYVVTLTPATGSTARTGYVVITATGCNETYHTQQLGTDNSVTTGNTPAITFQLKVTAATELQLEAHWGTSSYYNDFVEHGDQEPLYITQNETLTMTVNGVTELLTNSDPSTDPTEPSNTPTDTTQPNSEPTTEPAVEPTTEPAVEPTTEPAVEPTTVPTTEPMDGSEPTEQPQATEETTVPPQTEPETQDVTPSDAG